MEELLKGLRYLVLTPGGSFVWIIGDSGAG